MKDSVAEKSSLLAKLLSITLLATLFTFTNSFGQNVVKDVTYYATEDVKTQSPPEFPGGYEELVDFIRSEIKNSPGNVKLGRKMYLTAKIDEAGKVTVLKPAYKADAAMEKELKRIALQMPHWQAGKVNEKGVATDYTFLIRRNG